MDEAELNTHLEQMQNQLYQLVEQKGNFIDPKVVELSQQIDLLVLTIQRLWLKNKTNSNRSIE